MFDTVKIDFVDERKKVFNNRDLLKCALRAYISKPFYETFYGKMKRINVYNIKL